MRSCWFIKSLSLPTLLCILNSNIFNTATVLQERRSKRRTKISGKSCSNWNDPFNWHLSCPQDRRFDVPCPKIDCSLNMNLFGILFSVYHDDVWLFEWVRNNLRWFGLHPWSLQLYFVEKHWLHVGVPMNVVREVYNWSISAFQPISFHQSFSLESGKQIKYKLRASQQKTVPVYRIPVQENRFTFTSINPRGSVLKPPISCNSSFTSDVIWIFEAAKINSQRRRG